MSINVTTSDVYEDHLRRFKYDPIEEYGESGLSEDEYNYKRESNQTSDTSSFPLRYELIRNAESTISQLEKSEKTELTKDILCKAMYWASFLSSQLPNFDNIPKIKASELEDSSILIEWAFENWRIGFGIENEIEESSWHLVSNENLGNISASGYLTKVESRRIILWLLFFVALHQGLYF